MKILFFIILASLFFSSCSKHDELEANKAEYQLNNFLYEVTVNAYENQNEGNVYFPESLKNFLDKTYLIKGELVTTFRLLFPDRLDITTFVNFYDMYSDDGKWIDKLLMEIEEQRIATELLEMEERLDNFHQPVNEEQKAQEKEKQLTQLITKEIKDADRTLGYMTYGNETFIPQHNNEGTILIHSYEGNVTRSFYDKLYRCYREETWVINENKEELITTKETDFRENTYIPLTINIKNENNLKKQLFNYDGQVITEENYIILKDEKSEDEKFVIKSSLKLKYNKKNKVRESSFTEYKYRDDTYTKLSYSFNKKYIYSYNNDDIPPNFDYYENEVLKVRNRYSSKDNYTSRIYFDDGYNVTTFYQNNKPVKEVFATKDGVERVKYHE